MYIIHNAKNDFVCLTRRYDMSKLFKATMIVTIFSVLTRALGFVLRIILSRALGAESLGYYQVSMSVLGVLMTLIASGIPLVVSRSVANKKAIGDHISAYKTTTAGLIVSLVLSVTVCLIIYLCPQVLNIIYKQNLTSSIVFFALPSLIFSAVYCALRSALWGDKHFFAISFTEFFEQVVRIILCFILLYFPIFKGIGLAEKAALSLSIACLLSSILVVIIYYSLKQKLVWPKGSIKPLIKASAPITALRTISSIVSTLISIIIPIRLAKFGFSSGEAMAEYGTMMGMAFPLIMTPGTLIGSLAVTLVPEISSKTDNIDQKLNQTDLKGLKSHICLGLNMSVLITAILIPAFIVLAKPICEILFHSKDAGEYVQKAAILMIPMGLSQISSSMLNSIGLELKSLIGYGIGAGLLFISIYFLPKYIGTNALIVGMGILWSSCFVFNIIMLRKRKLMDSSYLKTLGLVLIFSLFSSLLTWFTYRLLINILGLILSTCICGIISVIAMILLYWIFDVAGFKGFMILKNKSRFKKTKIVKTT